MPTFVRSSPIPESIPHFAMDASARPIIRREDPRDIVAAHLRTTPAHHLFRGAVPVRYNPVAIRNDHGEIGCALEDRPLPRLAAGERYPARPEFAHEILRGR